MVEFSIICLIYKSPKLADKFYESLINYTPKLKNGEAEFFFVANDPTKEVYKHLKKRNYPFILNINKKLSPEEMLNEGYGKPEYIRRVYQGYNEGIKHAKGKKVVLVNSDNFFSKDWLENLDKYLTFDKVICSTLVEPTHPTYGTFPEAKCANFGRTLRDFDNNKFQTYANMIKKTGLKSNGAFMPCMMYKDAAILAGLYPLGNISNGSFEEIKYFGDEFFYQKLSSFGIKQYTSKDSIVYHLKEGEKDTLDKEKVYIRKPTYKYDYNINPNSKFLVVDLKHTKNQSEIIKQLLNYVSIIIFDYKSEKELIDQIENIEKQTYLKKQIVVVCNNIINQKSKIIEKFKNVFFVDFDSNDYVYRVILAICKSEGSYILLSSPKVNYREDLLSEMFRYMNDNNCWENVIYYEESKGSNIMNPFNLLLPKDLLIKNTPDLLNTILGDKFTRLDLDNFNGMFKMYKIFGDQNEK